MLPEEGWGLAAVTEDCLLTPLPFGSDLQKGPGEEATRRQLLSDLREQKGLRKDVRQRERYGQRPE